MTTVALWTINDALPVVIALIHKRPQVSYIVLSRMCGGNALWGIKAPGIGAISHANGGRILNILWIVEVHSTTRDILRIGAALTLVSFSDLVSTEMLADSDIRFGSSHFFQWYHFGP